MALPNQHKKPAAGLRMRARAGTGEGGPTGDRPVSCQGRSPLTAAVEWRSTRQTSEASCGRDGFSTLAPADELSCEGSASRFTGSPDTACACSPAASSKAVGIATAKQFHCHPATRSFILQHSVEVGTRCPWQMTCQLGKRLIPLVCFASLAGSRHFSVRPCATEEAHCQSMQLSASLRISQACGWSAAPAMVDTRNAGVALPFVQLASGVRNSIGFKLECARICITWYCFNLFRLRLKNLLPCASCSG